MKDFEKLMFVSEEFSSLFSFNAVSANGKIQYGVSVVGKGNEKIFFTMQQQFTGSWKIINAPKVPEWITGLQEQLSEAIVEYRTANSIDMAGHIIAITS